MALLAKIWIKAIIVLHMKHTTDSNFSFFTQSMMRRLHSLNATKVTEWESNGNLIL